MVQVHWLGMQQFHEVDRAGMEQFQEVDRVSVLPEVPLLVHWDLKDEVVSH